MNPADPTMLVTPITSGPHAGKVLVVYRMMFNDRICVSSVDQRFYERAFCFPQDGSAAEATDSWDGTGDPPGSWIKEVGTDRYGPGMKDWDQKERLRLAGCRCDPPLLGYRPKVGPRCRLCNTIAYTEIPPPDEEQKPPPSPR